MKNTIKEVEEEMERALEMYGDFISLHEGYAVLLEEVDEMWEEIKKNPKTRNPGRVREEAIQVAAMALKLIDYIDNK